MVTTVNPLTELEAVNSILKNMGEQPVNSLSGDIPLDAAQALQFLESVSRKTQTRGWYFNTEYYRLSPDGDGYIHLPANTLQVRGSGNDEALQVTNRGGKLYNMTPFQHGFDWTDRSVVELEIVLGLSFDLLPQTAKNYVTLKASQEFQIAELGDEMSAREDDAETIKAWAELEHEQTRKRPYSMRDSYTVSSALPTPQGLYFRLR